MTVQRALEIIKDEMPYESGVINEALNMVENAVKKKQIPKKPITDTVNRGILASGEYDIDTNYLCPNYYCNTVVGDYDINEAFYKFCPECGQALDWSDLKK